MHQYLPVSFSFSTKSDIRTFLEQEMKSTMVTVIYKTALLLGQIIINQLQIAAGVFQMNVRALLSYHVDEKEFCEVRAHECVVEF